MRILINGKEETTIICYHCKSIFAFTEEDTFLKEKAYFITIDGETIKHRVYCVKCPVCEEEIEVYEH